MNTKKLFGIIIMIIGIITFFVTIILSLMLASLALLIMDTAYVFYALVAFTLGSIISLYIFSVGGDLKEEKIKLRWKK